MRGTSGSTERTFSCALDVDLLNDSDEALVMPVPTGNREGGTFLH